MYVHSPFITHSLHIHTRLVWVYKGLYIKGCIKMCKLSISIYRFFFFYRCHHVSLKYKGFMNAYELISLWTWHKLTSSIIWKILGFCFSAISINLKKKKNNSKCYSKPCYLKWRRYTNPSGFLSSFWTCYEGFIHAVQKIYERTSRTMGRASLKEKKRTVFYSFYCRT